MKHLRITCKYDRKTNLFVVHKTNSGARHTIELGHLKSKIIQCLKNKKNSSNASRLSCLCIQKTSCLY